MANSDSIEYVNYVNYYRQDLPQAALQVLFLLTIDFLVFRPAGQHVAPIKVKFGREDLI